MREEYLWDRSGEPDPEIQRLEEVLGRLRPPDPPQWRASSKVHGNSPQARWRAAMAAAVALMFTASWLVSRPLRAGWKVARVEGTPLIGASPVRTTGQLAVGEALVTDAASRAKIDVGNIGEVELDPNSRLRLVRAHRSDHRLALDHGTLHAIIWAPPRLFSVETPAAVAVDLGCAYTLKVDRSGTTTLHVTTGWVAFEHDGRESWVPAGAECVSRAGAPPGTPYFVDALETFRSALAAFDSDSNEQALAQVLSSARQRDALTLWHLLPKTSGAARAQVYDRMAELEAPPAGVTRGGVLGGDRRMLDLWWDTLQLGDSSWWRMWKGPSPFAAK